jgi:peptidoglycan/LPS O-acetylase OafA/YrhL
LGVLTAHGLDSEEGFRLLSTVTYPRFCSLAWLLAVIGLAWLRAPELVLSIAMVGLVASSVVRRDHALAPLFNWGPVQAVGKVSYGMYMWHQLCLSLIRKFIPLPPIALFASGSVGAFAVASASYHWYESIFLRMKSRFSHQ